MSSLLQRLVGIFLVLSLFASSDAFAKKRTGREVRFKNDITALTAIAGQTYSQNLKDLLSKPGIGALVWSTAPDMPAWLALDSAVGRLTGTPSVSDAGTKSFRLNVQDNDSGAITRIDMKVALAPFWVQDPVLLGKQMVGKPWSVELSTFVQNASGVQLTFSVKDPSKLPRWMSLTPSGKLSGTPTANDVGVYSGFSFVVTDPSGNQAAVSAKGEVGGSASTSPTWMANPIVLENATEEFPYSQDISGPSFVVNPSAVPLTFSLTGSVPAWLKISPTGSLYGTPGKKDVGPVSVGARLSGTANGVTYSADTVLNFSVGHTNHTPVWSLDPIVLPNQKINTPLSTNLSTYASDPDGDKLTFKILAGPSWATVTDKGILSGTPDKNAVGNNEWVVAASDAEFSPRATVRIKVFKTGPSWLANPSTLPDAAEDKPYSQDLKPLVKNPDSDSLVFKILAGPSWAAISDKGFISGTPKPADAGIAKFTITVTDGVSPVDQAEVDVKVVHVNHSPYWTSVPVVLGSAKENGAYSSTVAGFAADPDAGDVLTFKKISGPGWLAVDKSGLVAGVPKHADLGLNTFKVSVTDLGGLSAEGTVQITVTKDNHAPTWTQDPIELNQVTENSDLAFDISPYAKDADGDPLTFKLIVGPSWLQVSPKGMLTGTPRAADVGAFTAVFEVSDGLETKQAGGRGTVIAQIKPPVVHTDLMNFSVRERQNFTDDLGLAKYVSDPQGLPLSFTPQDTKDWLTFSPNGKIAISPKFKDIGNYAIRFSVSNGKVSSNGVMNVTVVRDPRPPVWLQNPVNFTANARQIFTGVLSDKVKDLDGLPLSFTLKSGPNWMTVDSNGNLQGTPPDNAVGANSFVVVASNDVTSAEGTVVVTVLATNHPPVWLQDPIQLPEAVGLSPYSNGLADFAKDTDNDALIFTKESGPDWVKIGKDGKVSGTPTKADVGLTTLKVRVSDPSGPGPVATINITVKKPNLPPKWVKDPIPLPDATEGTAFGFELSPWAVDVNGDPLTFKMVSGPKWLSVSNSGTVSGTPGSSDVGAFTAIFSANNGKFEVEVGAVGRVIGVSPVIHQENLNFTVKERQTLDENLKQAKYVEDLSGRPLTFTLIDGSPFATLSPKGALHLAPSYSDIGSYKIKFKADNGVMSTSGILNVTVVRDPRPPVWLENPIRVPAMTKTPFNYNLPDKVKDLDGLAVTYNKKSGPDWLTVSPTGQITGTPGAGDVGEVTLVVSAKNDLLSSDGSVILSVVADNHPPVWLQDPISLKPAEVNKSYAQSVSSFATDPEGDPISFSKAAGPAWAYVTTSGLVIGVPTPGDLGLNTIKVRATDPKGAYTDATVNLKVTSGGCLPPVWSKDPIPLGATNVGAETYLDLNNLASDPANGAITFRKISGPNWMMLSSNGRVTGSPANGDVGEYSAIFEASNGMCSSQVGAYGKVTGSVCLPPKWMKDPIPLGTTKVGAETYLNLNNLVSDPADKPITFKKISGPNWLMVSSNGRLTGSPASGDVGEYSAIFEANNGGCSSQVGANGKVTGETCSPPTIQAAATHFTVGAGDKLTVNFNQPKYISNPSGSALSFKFISSDNWLSLDSQGKLIAIPSIENVGNHTYTLVVTNAQGQSDQKDVTITVTAPCKPPEWLQNPIRFDAKINVPLTRSIASFASSSSGAPMTFTKINGPDWLVVAANGDLTGTPTTAGPNSFQISASNGCSTCTPTTLIINVTSGSSNMSDKITIDDVVPGAPIQNLWVIDNVTPHPNKDKLIRQLKENIQIYNDALDQAQVHHTGVMISAVPSAPWNGLPVEDEATPLMLWSDASWVRHFQSRLNTIHVRKAHSSPLWSMFRLYSQAPSLPIFGNTYFVPGVPMEVMVVTKHGDCYPIFSKNTPQTSWAPRDFAENFVQLHHKWQIPYRTSVIAPLNDKLFEPDDQDVDKSRVNATAYRALTQSTKGVYYGFDENSSITTTLTDYAKKNIFRAYVAAKQKIELKNRPSDPSLIRVFLQGNELKGNWGSIDDVWTYDASSGKPIVTLRWDRIDMSVLNPGDTLEIRYTVR